MALLDKIKDKQVEVKYESGDHYLMTYLSSKELRWEALGEVKLLLALSHTGAGKLPQASTMSTGLKQTG